MLSKFETVEKISDGSETGAIRGLNTMIFREESMS